MTADPPPKSEHSRAWLLAGLAVVFLRALPNLRFPIGRDQATYCVIGQGLLHGQLLYRDLWDNKPPGIFYIYALIVKIFGPVMWSVGVVDILWLLAISLCIFYFARRFMGVPAATLAMVFNAARHCRQGYIHAAQPETFVMLCVFAAWFLLGERDPSPSLVPRAPSLLGRGEESGERMPCVPFPQERRLGWTLRTIRCLGAGLVLGVAFWLKYNAVAFFPFLMILPFLDFRELDGVAGRVRLRVPWRDWVGRVLVVGAGFAVMVGGVLAYFRIAGAWPALKEVQFEVLPRYGAMALGITSNNFVVWALRQTQNHLGIWSEVAAALTLLIAWRRRELSRVAPAILMATAGYLSVAMQVRFHHPYYYETCYPFFAMFWGYISVKTYEGFQFLRRACAERRMALAGGLLWVVLVGAAASLLPEEGVRVAQQYQYFADWWRNPEQSYAVYWWQLPLDKLSGQIHVINFLKAHSCPDDEVYVWGTAPLINFLSQRRNPSRFVSNLALISLWAPDRWRQELVRTLETSRPRYIVVVRRDSIPAVSFTGLDSEQYLRVYPALAGVLERNYRKDVDFGDFVVYELK